MAGKEKQSLLGDTLQQNAVARGTLTRQNQHLEKVKEICSLDVIKALKDLSQKKIIALPEGEITKDYVTQHWETIEKLIRDKRAELGDILSTQESVDCQIPRSEKENQEEKDRLLMEKNVLKSIPPERAEMLLRLRNQFKFVQDRNGPLYENDYRNVIHLLHEGRVVFDGMDATEFPELGMKLYREMAPIGKENDVLDLADEKLGEAREIRDVYLNTKRPAFIKKDVWEKERAKLKAVVDIIETEGKYIPNRDEFDKILHMLPGNKIVALHLLRQATFNRAIVSYGKEVTYTKNTSQEKKFHHYIFGPGTDGTHYLEGILSYFEHGGEGSLPVASKIEKKDQK